MNKLSIVIDASVAAKWLLADEEDLIASCIKKDFAKRSISVAVPAFIFYEINNLLRSAVLSKRLSVDRAVNLYEAFLDLDFTVYWSKQLLKMTLQRAIEVNISSYDAGYVVLAEILQIPLYTANGKLIKKASTKLVLPLNDYPHI
ncbi:hypothetical protein A3C26_01920 [Candidatus Daviesbacteria bacterium RIFCSPHIGHO2_02_FULL_39_12]|uniref:PIN domain-containing protein n=2 Tax=Candidatus Daviesiibacteriota TaxID=1752718 RepID=A0A1F5JB47_9BACT|nr:MAG: hypothetical protein A3C26_01920 [Candidatus Daviesbacteria bacterium RIFCSPHIGHO2_02_FULL_39_12]OGE71472.1 MAG: hypothetical protein A3H40_03015 [Candidatus Daviesbacteria bacterium RIFCSPLOWO2_02_FULL_38_15]